MCVHVLQQPQCQKLKPGTYLDSSQLVRWLLKQPVSKKIMIVDTMSADIKTILVSSKTLFGTPYLHKNSSETGEQTCCTNVRQSTSIIKVSACTDVGICGDMNLPIKICYSLVTAAFKDKFMGID